MTESSLNSFGIFPAARSIETDSTEWRGEKQMDKEEALITVDLKLQQFHTKLSAFLREPDEELAVDVCLASREGWSFFWSNWEDYIRYRPGGAELFREGIEAACAGIEELQPPSPELEHVLISMREKITFIDALFERHDVQWVRDRMAVA